MMQRQPNPRNRMAGLADHDMTFCPGETPADGFSMNAALLYLPYRSFPLYLGQLDELRCCRGQYRCRIFVIPFDVRISIPAFDTLPYQQQVNPGTIIWGWNFSPIDGTVDQYTVQVIETCTKKQFFSNEGTNATALRPTGATDLFPVLTEPYEIKRAPGTNVGLLDISITNNANVAQRCQFCIMAAEPCSVQGVGEGPLPGFPWSPGMVQEGA